MSSKPPDRPTVGRHLSNQRSHSPHGISSQPNPNLGLPWLPLTVVPSAPYEP
jgi:hypothetical protein